MGIVVMMADLRTTPCDLHEITNCSTCTGLDKKLAAEDAAEDAAEWEQRGGVWPAKFAGVCIRCNLPFPEKARVVWTTKAGDFRPAHEEC